jgi:hypothetical protein
VNAHEGRSFDEARAKIDKRDLSRYVTADPERYQLYRLCECTTCEGRGKEWIDGYALGRTVGTERCPDCRGEGRTRDLIATCATPEALGVAIVTLGREGEWEGCPLGCLDTQGQPGEKWIFKPWTPSARNVSDAGRVLAKSKLGTESEARSLLPKRKEKT